MLRADLLARPRPLEPNNVFQRLAPSVFPRAQTVDRQKTIIGKNDTTLLVVHGDAIAELVKHPQRLLGRRAHPLRQGRVLLARQVEQNGLHRREVLPHAHPVAIGLGHAGHAQLAAPVRKKVSTYLLSMPLDTVLNVTLYQGLWFCWQAHTVKTPQVLPVVLPGMDVVCVFWKEAQEMLVPQHRPILRVKNAHTYRQGIQQRSGERVVRHGARGSRM